MSRELRIGDRVHTTQWNHQKRYHSGDRGTVLRTVKTHDGSLPFYLVVMDKDVPTAGGILFDLGEIEADV